MAVRPGEKQPPTESDVAELAGVSQSAVSRAFTPGASVAQETRKKILAAARRLGYHPNLIARSLSTKRSNIIGLALVLDDLKKPNFSVENTNYIADADWQNSVWNAMYAYQSDPKMTSDQVIAKLKSEYDAVFN